jgi:retron-type reverse transcriptase
VNHGILMPRIARKVKDERILKLIRRYLQAGLMADGIVSARTEGTPQGGPLSPLLSNILLTDLDRELERRGTSSAATPMTAISTPEAKRRDNGLWPRSPTVWSTDSSFG